MKSSKIFSAAAVAVLSAALCSVAVGQDHATPQEGEIEAQFILRRLCLFVGSLPLLLCGL